MTAPDRKVLLALLREIAPDRNHTRKCETEGDPDCVRCRINTLLAEPADAPTPVVEPVVEWWEDRIIRSVHNKRRITVQWVGPSRWYWSVAFEDHPRLPGGCIENWHDIAKSEEEAKAAALKCAKETP
jgi:hypothetical protein